MKKTMTALVLGAALWAPGGAVSASPVSVVTDIADGTACKMKLRVKELRTPYVSGGGPLGSLPDDVHFALVSVDDRNNALCQRAMAARDITMNGAASQLGGTTFKRGDRITGTVLYQQLMHGKMLYDAYHHLIMIEDGPGSPGVYSGFGLLP